MDDSKQAMIDIINAWMEQRDSIVATHQLVRIGIGASGERPAIEKFVIAQDANTRRLMALFGEMTPLQFEAARELWMNTAKLA